jgi:serine protease AprX
MYKLVSIIFYFLSVSLSAQLVGKIDKKLLSADQKKPHHIVVILKDQADLSEVKKIKGKDAKAKHVFTKLSSKAEKSQQEVKAFLNKKNKTFQSFYLVNMVALQADRELIQSISELPSVSYVMEDGHFIMEQPINDRTETGARAIEWNVNHINAPAVWEKGYTGQGVVIGGQDTGYEWDDPVIKTKYRGWTGTSANHDYNWHDAIYMNDSGNTGTNPCGYNLSVPCDDHSHGTHTMGTMVGDDGLGNQIGIAPGAKWIGCRNMERGDGTLSTYTECFQWFLAPYAYGSTPANGDPSKMPHVINNSWGCPPSEGCNTLNFYVMETALNNLRNAGCVIVVSAGNTGPSCSSVKDPAAIFSGSFTVGATNNADGIANFSSRGPVTVDGSNRLKPNISAPGVSIRSCVIGNNAFATWSGTSMAGPHVAGLVALLISANPELAGEVDKIENIIEQTAINFSSTENCGSVLGTSIPNNTFGYGRIDALASVNMAIPSNYPPYVTQSNDIIIKNSANGIVLVSQNLNKYRITVTNAGTIATTLIPGASSGSSEIKNSSLNMENAFAKIILRSPNSNYWQLHINNNGILTATLIQNIPSINTEITSGDIYISSGPKGLLLRSQDNTCFLTNISNLGQILTIPANCQN